MAIVSKPPPGSSEPKRREYAYPERRAWLAGVVADHLAGVPLDVASSYVAACRPVRMFTVQQRIAADSYEALTRGAVPEGILPPAEETPDGGERRIVVSIDRGGGFLRSEVGAVVRARRRADGGEIVRDRREASRLLRRAPDLRRFTLGLFAEPAAGGRKRWAPWTIARGLLFADLQPALGRARRPGGSLHGRRSSRRLGASLARTLPRGQRRAASSPQTSGIRSGLQSRR
jgi:hypothetical protein